MTASRPFAFVVKTFPKLSETFILEEILGLEQMQVPLALFALAPPRDELRHEAVARVRASSATSMSSTSPGPTR